MNAPPSPFYDIVPAELRSDEIRTEFVAANGLTFEVDKVWGRRQACHLPARFP